MSQAAHPDANIIFGATIDDALGDEVRVTVIAAGFDGGQPKRREEGSSLRRDARPQQSQAQTKAAVQALAARSEAAAPDARPVEPTAPRPAPTQVQFDDDDLDVPDFLK